MFCCQEEGKLAIEPSISFALNYLSWKAVGFHSSISAWAFRFIIISFETHLVIAGIWKTREKATRTTDALGKVTQGLRLGGKRGLSYVRFHVISASNGEVYVQPFVT